MPNTRTIEIKSSKDFGRLRRIALASQGLLSAEPFGCGLGGARAAINHIGYVQLDTISVVERAHHHVFYSRVPFYKPSMVNGMLGAGDIFEYWAHAAAFLPIADFRFTLPYKQAIKSGKTHWYKNSDKKLMANLLARIRTDGPLRARDLESHSAKRSGWWDWKPAKKALEQLYMEGDLMVRQREGFQKVYDLTERVLSSQVNTQMPEIGEFAEHLLAQQLRSHGVVSLKGLTYQRRNADLRKAMKVLVNDKIGQGEIQPVRLRNGELFLVEREAFDRRLPRLPSRLTILSPFDNAVIQRDRLKALFQFDYQIECYLPAAKRRYGYFSPPLLYRDEFVGRMDCKAFREKRHLAIKSLHWEQHQFEEDEIIAAFVGALAKFIRFQGCDSVGLDYQESNRLAIRLQKELKQLT